MAITSLDTYLAALRRRAILQKTASRTSVANIPFSVFDQAGNPGAGTMAVGNTANGIVPTNTSPAAGYPALAATSSLYINRILARSSVACWLDLYDTVFSAGAYVFNADVTLASQPSYASRLPGTDYNGLELWIEAATAFTGNQTVQINYLDQGGAAGDTGAIATGVAPILGRMLMLPLAAGDSGIQQITRVRSSVSTVGTFNVHVMRWLWGGRINAANQGIVESMFRTGMPQIYGTSALRLVVTADSTATGLPSLRLDLADG
jgi:hypothetical protein